MLVSLTLFSIESSDPTYFVYVLSSLLSKPKCKEVIRSHTNLIPLTITFGIIRTREEFDDAISLDSYCY
jgi:hypothetical protein